MRNTPWAHERMPQLRPALLLGGGLLCTFAVAITAAVALVLQWRAAVAEVERSAVSMATLLAAATERDLDAVVRGLRHAHRQLIEHAIVGHAIDPGRAYQRLLEESAQGSTLLRLTLVAADGTVQASSSPAARLGVSLADRQIIRDSLVAADGQLAWGQRRLSRITGDPAFGVALRLREPGSGRDLGAVLVPIATAPFERLLASMADRYPLRAWLLLDDRRILAGPPAAEDVLYPYGSPRDHGSEAAVARRVPSTAPTGGRNEQLLVLRAIDGFPLFVAVELDLDAAMAPWRARMSTFATAVALAVLLIAALSALAAWLAARWRGLGSALAMTRSRYQALVENSPDGIALLRDGRVVFANPALKRLAGRSPDSSLDGTRIGDIIDGHDGEPSALEYAGAPPDHPVHGEHWVRPLQGPPFEVETLTTPGGGDGDDSVQLVVHDISERKRVEARLRESEERYRLLVNGVPDCAFLLLTPAAVIDHASPEVDVTLLGPRERLLGRPLTSLLPEAADDMAALLRQAAARGSVERDGWIARSDGTRFWGHLVLSPIRGGDAEGLRGWHVLVRDITWRKELQDQIDHSFRRLEAMSIAVDEAREKEKLRLARELHDELGQSLSSMKLDLDLLEAQLPAAAEAAHRRLQAMREVLQQTVAVTRRISGDLRPLVLDDLGLDAALEWLVEQFRSRHTARCRLQVRGSPPPELPDALATALFRITQEGLTNVARHAGARQVAVELTYLPEALRLVVEDDGRGFDADRARRGDGFGLLGIRERARHLGGSVRVDSQPGRGTRIEVQLPLHPPPAAGATVPVPWEEAR